MRKTQLILLLMFATLTSALFAGFWDDVLKAVADGVSGTKETWGGRLTYLGAYTYSGNSMHRDDDRNTKIRCIEDAKYVSFRIQNTGSGEEKYRYNAYIKAYPKKGQSPSTVITFAKKKDLGSLSPTRTKNLRIHASDNGNGPTPWTFEEIVNSEPNYMYELHVELIEYNTPHRVIDSFKRWLDQ
jgi:hypothetical protein